MPDVDVCHPLSPANPPPLPQNPYAPNGAPASTLTLHYLQQKVLRSIKGPPEYAKKVDMQKVNLEVMKQWISTRIVEILGTEDDVVIDYAFSLLEQRMPDPKYIQYQLTGFLEKDTPAFCKQLWSLLLSAQDSKTGVPQELLEAKKEELRLEKVRRHSHPTKPYNL
ncbi:PWI domain-containing protein [Terfezia boudieri ATCC MYA-4762]|uniref:PWI domain-containing protein n=1 Tax=Terfezia boudieri ATCC MYA-4762 TaxID=1051890 RepID=A0A3N4LED5_9PEZI|nr:PWI domain-containing protein [Terfezia boudieri ATCC MYA-4762]